MVIGLLKKSAIITVFNCHSPTITATTTQQKSWVRYSNHQKTTLYPTHHKLKLQERARIEGYLENKPYISPKIEKLGPTLAQKITGQGQNAFKMTPKSKKSKGQKKILQKKSYLSIRVKPKKISTPSQLQTSPVRLSQDTLPF